jgi:NAD(P)-dependent dehydrogenase (short-subunit alcohol dehydrogenase family)
MNEVAIVTGAARGIGFELCRQLARRGRQVILTARNLNDAKAAAERLGDDGLVTPYALDVTRPDSCTECVGGVLEEFGEIDILVNNAAVSLDWDSNVWKLGGTLLFDTLATNVVGPLRLCQLVVPQMQVRGRGHVLNVSSDSGQLATMAANGPAYRLSKSMLNALTRMVAAAAGERVKVNAAHPGWTATAMGGEKAPRQATEAAASMVWLTDLPVDGPTGMFFFDRQALAW